MSLRARRLAAAALGTLGTLDAFYMLMYDEGLIEHLVCPFFGEGCEIVGRSAHAKHFGVPNAVVGALGYAGMAALALWAGDKPPEKRPWQPLAQTATAAVFAGTSVFLIYEMKYKVRAWCFWCLMSAGINFVLLPLSLADGRKAWKAVRPREVVRERIREDLEYGT